MTPSHVFLILISGLGVLHGLFLAAFLWVYREGNLLANKILSVLLLILSFRVGKSVLLAFTENLNIQIVFIGLATLMAIGPLYYFYCKALVQEDFEFKMKNLVHFVPTILGLCFGFWVDQEKVETTPKFVFAFVFVGYYLHYLIYVFVGYQVALKGKKTGMPFGSFALLRLLFYALLVIWFAYVLNLFDEFIPYIIGPIIYTLVAYSISLVVAKKGYMKRANHRKYRTTLVPDEQVKELFAKAYQLVVAEKQFQDYKLSLKSLSKQLNVTTQTLSMVINKESKMNFNSFINHHRIAESIRIFQNPDYQNHTIAAIAFEVGFNSISSFNSNFKKLQGSTPLAFRKKLTE